MGSDPSEMPRKKINKFYTQNWGLSHHLRHNTETKGGLCFQIWQGWGGAPRLGRVAREKSEARGEVKNANKNLDKSCHSADIGYEKRILGYENLQGFLCLCKCFQSFITLRLSAWMHRPHPVPQKLQNHDKHLLYY